VSQTPHYLGHRQRLRERLDADSRLLSDYEVLELLLAHALPRKDTKPMAKELLSRFGSLAEVLSAAPSRLTEIAGLGPATATYWRLLHECRARQASQGLNPGRTRWTASYSS